MLNPMNHSVDGRMAKVYTWQRSYQDALLELDPAELHTKIGLAVSDLEKRNRELMLSQDAEAFSERQAIADALNGLDSIRKHELAMPVYSGGQMRQISA
jgi:hypothetical protein